MPQFIWFLCNLCLFLITFTSAFASAAAASAPPKLTHVDCWFDIPEERKVDCYHLNVPETRIFNMSMGLGKVLNLPVVIIRANQNGEKVSLDPIVYLAGGPGDGAWLDQERIAWWWEFVATATWTRKRDLILFDQRGSGLSEPRIDCPEVRNIAVELLTTVSDAAATELEATAVAACGKRLLAEGFNPAAYTSRDSAADLHDLFTALDIPVWNVYGLSYGTRLALEYMRQYPHEIRAVMLDSVLPPEAQLFEDDAATTDHAFRMIFKACAAQTKCAAAYGDLEKRLLALVQKLDDAPLEIERPSPLGKGTIKVRVDGELLIYSLFKSLYTRPDLESVPQLIDIYERNNRDAINSDIDNYIADFIGREDFGEAMFMSVQCQEELPFNDMTKAVAAYQDYPLLEKLASKDSAGGLAKVCASWRRALPQQPLRQEDTKQVVSDLPTLIFAGLFDPVTPPRYARMAAANLINAFYLEFDGLGHDVIGNDSCANIIAAKFLDAPASSPRDICLGYQTPPNFLMPLQ